jgi:hypothetical protein
MAKLKLHVEELVVESFTAAEEAEKPGTVLAHQQSGPYTDECQSCGVATGCGGGGCNSDYCSYNGCGPTNTCYAYYTCAGAYTCGEVESCRYPECTAAGAIC